MKIRKVEKLVPSLKNKKTYVVHIENLDQALTYGLRLKKYTELLDLNKANGWSLMSCYGQLQRTSSRKTFYERLFLMENIRNHKDIKLGDKPKEIW